MHGARFEIAWKNALDEFINGESFHMRDFAHGIGLYQGWQEQKRREFLGKLMSAILDINPRFVGCVASITDFKALPGSLRESLRDPYYIGFQEVTRGLSIIAEVENNSPVSMTYAMHLKHGATEAGMAAQLWNTMRDTEARGEWMGDYSALLPKHVYALQAADLFAYELTREFESICGRSERGMRWAMKQFVKHNDGTDIFMNAYVSPIYEVDCPMFCTSEELV